MNITQTAIERNRVTFVILFAVLLAGIMAFQGMPRAEDPGFTIRTAMVLTYFPGASPERVETLITDKLEKSIQEIPELDYVNSESRSGISIIFVNIKQSYKKMRPIWDSLRRKVEKAEGELPEGMIGPFVNDEFGDIFGTIITLTGEGFSYAQLKEVADEVRNELLLIDDVAKVEIHGAQDERIFVEYNDARLAEVGLSASQLINILQNQNIVIRAQQQRITGHFERVAIRIVERPVRVKTKRLFDLLPVPAYRIGGHFAFLPIDGQEQAAFPYLGCQKNVKALAFQIQAQTLQMGELAQGSGNII